MAPAVAVLAARTEIVVLATVPAVGVSVIVAWYVVPFCEISVRSGERRVGGDGKLLPVTVNVLAVPAVPAVEVPKSSVVGVTVIVATAAVLTVPVRVTFC